jgi:FtsP/CotA-like multicopper oxidase with cupredoxin domain
LAGAALTLLVPLAAAQTKSAPFQEPPKLAEHKPPRAAAKALDALRAGVNRLTAGTRATTAASGHEIRYELPIQFTEGTINNPATGALDRVRLRSYGERFLAPTVVMRPGQTVRMALHNKLPAEPECAAGKSVNQPHCFNTTNLHSHGLWVSPTGNSDNVLLSIQPGVAFEYEYNVPDDHPAGTFWYHPHKHGSTAMQVGSGMAGVLIVKGERFPTPYSTGDLDTLLQRFKPRAGDYAQVMLLQQIAYACFDEQGQIQKDAEGHWVCNPGQVGEVKDFDQQFSRTAWVESGRHTLINGVARPHLQLAAGRVYRWRLVHSGVRESIALRIRKIEHTAKLDERALSGKARAAEVEHACTGRDVSQFEVAADGLTRAAIFEKTVNNLQPGYRSDVLFALPEQGSYCVYDAGSDDTGSITAAPENPKVLAIISAQSGRSVADMRAFVLDELLAAAQGQPTDVRAQVQTELREWRLTSFVPHASVTDEELAQSGQPVVPIDFNITGTPTEFQVNGEPFDPSRVDQRLILGRAQAWRLSASVGSHPFHIHVNPFQITSIKKKGADGQPSGPDITDGQYAGMLGTWKDTIFVQPDVVIETRTRYLRYIGEFVLHCHILDHEDQGMMQIVEVVLPDADGKAMSAGHH